MQRISRVMISNWWRSNALTAHSSGSPIFDVLTAVSMRRPGSFARPDVVPNPVETLGLRVQGGQTTIPNFSGRK
jgi:hypothetical protein